MIHVEKRNRRKAGKAECQIMAHMGKRSYRVSLEYDEKETCYILEVTLL